LKGCMEGQSLILMILGRNIASWTLVCLRNRQVDPPWINRGTPKK
jgi:hypothetical protein